MDVRGEGDGVAGFREASLWLCFRLLALFFLDDACFVFLDVTVVI